MTSFSTRSHLFLAMTLTSLGAFGVTACGAEDPTPGAGDVENAGSVGFDLDIGPDVKVNSVSYDISGNGFHKTGSLNVTNSRTLRATIGGIPAGNGYIITLRGVDFRDARIECLGSTTFNVTAGQATTANVRFQCILPRGNGSLIVTGTGNVCPRIDAVSVEPSETAVGGTLALSSAVTDSDRFPAPVSYSWRSSGGMLANASSATPTFTCTAAGDFSLTLDVTDGECGDSVSTAVTCSGGDIPPPPPPNLKVNEVESSGGVPGDWTEIFNAGTTAVDISGFVFRDNDDTHTFTIPNGTSVAPGGNYLVEEAAQGFGLGAADSARLFDRNGVIVDSFSWTAHAATTYGRCPNGTGMFTTTFSSTKGAVNECPGVVTTAAWPGADSVTTVDGTSVFGGNLSGLTYQAATGGSPAVLWAVRNGPGAIYRLIQSGATWIPDPANDWGAGKSPRYTDGTGNPDSEGVTFAEAGSPFAYISTERNNDASTISRPSILRVDVTAVGTSLTATNEWALVGDLPVVGANLGLEAITFVPDAFLVSNSFFDESANKLYAPADYPLHGTGLFLVGLEANGTIYAFALNADSTFRRIATIASGHPGMMGIEFDREVGYLWAACDDSCQGQISVLRIDTLATSPTFGRFVVRRKFARPTTMPNLNNEGIAFAPEAECVAGQKAFFWADDGETGGHSLRRDTIPCGSFF